MFKFWVIFKREYAQVVKKKSFIVGIFVTPVFMGALILLPTFLADMKSSESETMAIIDQSERGMGREFAVSLERYTLEDSVQADQPSYTVDSVFEIAPDDEARFKAVQDSLGQLIIDDELTYYLVIREQAYLCDTCSYLVTNSNKFRTIQRFENRFSEVLSSQRLAVSNINLEVDSVLSLTRHVNLPIRDAKGQSLPFLTKYMGAMIFVLIMFAMIIAYGQMVMRSVIEEKNSRVMEVLVSSVSPFQLMLGKICGLGAATFTQVAIWVILGAGIYSMKGALSVDASIDRIVFNPLVVVFFVLFLTTGYLLFSTIFALVGSIVTTEKEAQNYVMPITMSMMLPVIIGMYIIQQPNSTFSIVLSLIPIFTPTTMMMRVVFLAPTASSYSIFSGIAAQATLGFILLVAAVIGMIWLTGKIFRVGILMYGKRATLPEIIRWVKY